nr:DUF4177 domain-containing protein [Rhodovulum bhavnagarense]
MAHHEYRVLPAPTRGLRARGVKGAEDRFAHALSSLMNDMAREGWEYLRAETLPCEERQGLTGKTTVFRNLLVFRRLRNDPDDDATLLTEATTARRGPRDPEDMAEIAAQSLHPELGTDAPGLAGEGR